MDFLRCERFIIIDMLIIVKGYLICEFIQKNVSFIVAREIVIL